MDQSYDTLPLLGAIKPCGADQYQGILYGANDCTYGCMMEDHDVRQKSRMCGVFRLLKEHNSRRRHPEAMEAESPASLPEFLEKWQLFQQFQERLFQASPPVQQENGEARQSDNHSTDKYWTSQANNQANSDKGDPGPYKSVDQWETADQSQMPTSKRGLRLLKKQIARRKRHEFLFEPYPTLSTILYLPATNSVKTYEAERKCRENKL